MEKENKITYEQFRLKLQPLVDEIFDWFDFAEAVRIAKYQKKTIMLPDGSTDITIESELREHARKQLYRLIDEVWNQKILNDFLFLSDNIFMCEVNVRDSYDNVQISLRYVAAEWTAGDC